MAEGGEGEDEIQFLRTVSRFCTHSGARVTVEICVAPFFVVVCGIMTANWPASQMLFYPIAFDNPVPSCKILKAVIVLHCFAHRPLTAIVFSAASVSRS